MYVLCTRGKTLGRRYCHVGLPKPTSKTTIKQLKEIITQSGLSHTDCYDKKDLLQRAQEAYERLQQPSQTQPNQATWPSDLTPAEILARTKLWLERMVVGLNWCPFAKAALPRLEYLVVPQAEGKDLLSTYRQVIIDNVIHLSKTQDSEISSKILVFPDPRLGDLDTFQELSGALQIGSEKFSLIPFHPVGVKPDVPSDHPQNFLVRAPWPTLHLIRDSQFRKAQEEWFAASPDRSLTEIKENNIKSTTERGYWNLDEMLNKCQKGVIDE